MLQESLIKLRDEILLHDWINSSKSVFEWGIGERSIQQAARAKSYTSVYYDERLIAPFKDRLQDISLIHVKPDRKRNSVYEPAHLGDFVSYVKSIQGKYDVIIINGRDRVNCAKQAREHLNEDGVVIVQDFWNRIRYSEILDYYEVVDGFNNFSNSPFANFVILRPKPKNQKKLLIYSGYSQKGYNAASLKKQALGGSETATIRTAKEFRKLGYDVVVAGQVIDSVWEDGVRYLERARLQEFLDRNKLDVVIISRYMHFMTLYRFHTDQLYLLNHDVCYLPWGIDRSVENDWNKQAAVGDMLFRRTIEKFNGVICLTDWHKAHYGNLYPFTRHKLITWGNGIEFEMFPEPKPKKKNKFVWVSRAARGLRRMLEMWPDIKERYPDATLEIFSYSGDGEQDVVQTARSLPGVTHHGGVPQSVLLDEIQDAEYWFYPTNFSETYCITALEMQYSKVCCVCTNLAALRNTAGDRAVTFEIPRQGYQSEEFKKIALDSLFKVMEDEELKQSLIEKAYNWSLEQSWMHRAKELDKLFQQQNDKYIESQSSKWSSE